MMNVRPEHYIRVIKATHSLLVCRYSDSSALEIMSGTAYSPERRGQGRAVGTGTANTTLGGKNLTVIFGSSEEEITVRTWVNFKAL